MWLWHFSTRKMAELWEHLSSIFIHPHPEITLCRALSLHSLFILTRAKAEFFRRQIIH